MNDKLYTFTNRSELAKYLGISRNTLNSRLLKLDVQVAQFPCSITQKQLEQLHTDLRKKNNINDSKNNEKNSNHTAKEQNINPWIELDKAKNKIERLQETRISEQKKHQQIMISMHEEVVHLANQSQQLQLDLQQKLTQHSSEVEQLKLENKMIQEELAQEKVKSFWQKLFHK